MECSFVWCCLLANSLYQTKSTPFNSTHSNHRPLSSGGRSDRDRRARAEREGHSPASPFRVTFPRLRCQNEYGTIVPWKSVRSRDTAFMIHPRVIFRCLRFTALFVLPTI